MNVLVVDPDAIYRTGVVACLRPRAEIDDVREAATAREAWTCGRLDVNSAIIVEPVGLDGGLALIAQLTDATPARLLVCSSCDDTTAIAALRAGAHGFLSKRSLAPETLAAAVVAAAHGACVIESAILTRLSAGDVAPATPEVRLDRRETTVLELAAGGHSTREMAVRMAYSERTIKNIVRSAVTKLEVRSRSEAVAVAVRDGLISVDG